MDTAKILRATLFAAEKHSSQRRKDGVSPYINHPLELANLLANDAGIVNTDVICAALLHDTIEDTETTAAELEALFGAQVTAIVLEVTDDKSLPKLVRKQQQIEAAPDLSHAAKLVKLADKICNLRDLLTAPPRDWSVVRKLEYFDWAAAVVAGLRGTHPVLEALFAVVYAHREDLA
ncbi:MAG: phosphohydrolase [Desulfuromonas sp.]|nr:MAG: phosphohydrolase [Desulfuromonas sp.]